MQPPPPPVSVAKSASSLPTMSVGHSRTSTGASATRSAIPSSTTWSTTATGTRRRPYSVSRSPRTWAVQFCREAIPGVRGRIDVSATVKGNTRSRARVVCEFDEFTADVPHNRIIRATVRKLMRVPDLDPELHDRLSALYLRLDGITDIRLTSAAFRSVQLHRNNRFYRFLIAVCRIVNDHLLVDETTGETQFRDFVRDEKRMRRLFERFVRNFFKREQKEFKVKRSKFTWAAAGETELLPGMNTDVTLTGPGRVIVVETKYTATQFQDHFGSKSIRSEHLYQVFAYLVNMQTNVPESTRVEGILLYPRVAAGPDFRCELHGHPLRVTTVDLSLKWPELREALLGLFDPP